MVCAAARLPASGGPFSLLKMLDLRLSGAPYLMEEMDVRLSTSHVKQEYPT